MAASIPAMRKRSASEEDTKGIKSTDADQELYKNFPEVISGRWQQEIAETVFETINREADKLEHNKKAKMGFDDMKDSDCIIHGYLKKLVASEWETRYGKLYPNRLELHTESSSAKPELIFMDVIEEVVADYVMVKGEQCIVLKMIAGKGRDEKIILTNSDEICLKEWLTSLKSTYKNSLELLASIEETASKIFQGLTVGVI